MSTQPTVPELRLGESYRAGARNSTASDSVKEEYLEGTIFFGETVCAVLVIEPNDEAGHTAGEIKVRRATPAASRQINPCA
jgi:hypothetical protein